MGSFLYKENHALYECFNKAYGDGQDRDYRQEEMKDRSKHVG